MGLILDSASYAYGAGRPFEVPALVGVTLEVQRGSLTLVLGSTGSGKSTLLKVAAGLLQAQRGSVAIDGRPLTLDTARGSVGLVFQDPEAQLFADTLLDDVAFGPKNLGLTPEEAMTSARDALSEVGLDPVAYGARSPFSLSGGEARRAAIAGVLSMAPSYLLADEPTAGLDATGRAAVKRLLLAQRERAGVVVVSHAAEEFLGEADYLMILDAGEVGWAGPAAAAIQSPEIFSAHGLRAPEVLEVQRIAADAGHRFSRYTLDPDEAARMLVGGGV